MPGHKYVTVRGKDQGLLGQAFTMPRRTHDKPNFRDHEVATPKGKPPKRRAWKADPTMVQDIGRRSPKHRAPAPARQEHFDETGNSGAQCFEQVKLLGEGGQGRCDLYRRPVDGKYFVRKIMKCHVQVERNKPVEVKIIRDILGKHERLCRLYNFEWTPNRTILWFEHCAGGDLNDIIHAYTKNHNLLVPEGFIWHTFLQLAEATAFLHAGYDRTGVDPPNWQPIVHRDIKPQNIFIRKPIDDAHYPEVVLADFGLATTKTRSSENGICGTMLWQGPEIPLHSAAGDVWAIGACIHALATGAAPIAAPPKGVDARAWYEKSSSRQVQDLTKYDYSRYLDSMLHKATRTNPMDRLIGRGLVKRVERGWNDWSGEKEPLEPWALKC